MHLAGILGPLMGYLPHHRVSCVAPSNELLHMLASLHVKLVDIMLTFDVSVHQTAHQGDLKLPGLVLFHHVLASATSALWTVAQANQQSGYGIATDTITCHG